VAAVERTNFCDIGLALESTPEGNHLIVESAIDNLVKGAAGQAVQCMNIRFGLPEATGFLPQAGSALRNAESPAFAGGAA
jgi:N-acetyl-gamma-glutamylphosphate reductase